MLATTKQTIAVKRVLTEQQAYKIANLYISYYQQDRLSKEDFLNRWHSANSNNNYFMIAAWQEEEPLGFLDFSIIPSIFWAPYLARFDSIYIKEKSREIEITDALFDQAFLIMKQNKVSMISAVSCSSYQQEVSILATKLSVDNNPIKTFFIRTDSFS